MTDRNGRTSPRKLDHLRICAQQDIERGSAGFDDVQLLHTALPECDMDEIDVSIEFLGRSFPSPLLIEAMTGGHPETREVNRALASAAQTLGIGMGVGSQRAALEDPSLEDTFSVVRDEAPDAFLIANIGIVQLRDHGYDWAERACAMIDADAIAIHLNFLQESIQPEGDHDAGGCLFALRELCQDPPCPVIVKETGSGISAATGSLCFDAGVSAIDIGGFGGTNWAAVEGLRGSDPSQVSARSVFEGWGIPTVASLVDMVRLGRPVIASGGIRSGLDMAKALALGGRLTGIALPLLKPALKGHVAVCDAAESFLHELRVAMFLTGSPRIPELRRAKVIISGDMREMIAQMKEDRNGN